MTLTISKQDIVPLNVYRQGRDEYVKKMIDYKKTRRIKLGEYISILFENKNTVLFQILELLHSEDLEDPAEIEEYLDIYSGMLPGENELSATLFIELDNQEKLQDLLVKLKGIEHHLTLTIAGETNQAVFEEEHDDRDFTTSVHYLKFPLTQTAINLLTGSSADSIDVKLILNHPSLTASVTLSPNNISSIQKDLV
ncbi:DUF3501 family protein [Bacillus benzoevorans]|uniref:DUF3501 family protein n=1 Tax=Bacillus benzoevorans TaxID=1456 RepID=A0A7X0HRA8_9BACI|nr:DUF3501 family protein [Bacillus benzoevorans]MBB6445389.1 hypothetical protein [Bacillus benzoevorans]